MVAGGKELTDLRSGGFWTRLPTVTAQEAQALLVLAPDAFVRVGVRCPYCRRVLHAQSRWRIQGQLLDWVYECECCGTSLDSTLKVVRRPAWL